MTIIQGPSTVSPPNGEAAPLHATGCRHCGSHEQPLHPDGATSITVADGVVRDSVVCTRHLVIP